MQRRLIKNKKGIFMATLAMLLITLFVISYTIVSTQNHRESIQKRVSTMNSFVSATEQDISRRLYISGYRTILVWQEHIFTTKTGIPNVSQSINESLFGESFQGNPHNFLEKTGYAYIVESINEEASKINVNVSITNPRIEIVQEDPWHVKVTLFSDLLINDTSNLAHWNKSSSISALIPIENFDDPLYLMNANGFSNKLVKSPFTFPTSSTFNLSIHLDNGYYISNTDAPSFLNRLQGNSSANEYGIESLVSQTRLQSHVGAPAGRDKSAVDHIYFSDENPLPLTAPLSQYPWFKLDDSHLTEYYSP